MSSQKNGKNIESTLISWTGSQGRKFSQRMADIEKAFEDGHLSIFWNNLKKETRIKLIGAPVRALIEVEQMIANKTEVNKKIRLTSRHLSTTSTLPFSQTRTKK